MSRPLVTVVIPTQGRATLPRALASLRPEHHDGVRAEVLVVADTHGPLLSNVARAAGQYGARYLELDAGRHDWGYPQLNYGYEHASAGHLMNIGDDDVMIPGSLRAIVRAIGDSEPGPILFQAELHPSPNRGDQRVPVVLWSDVGDLRRGRVTGQNLCAPNDPSRLGRFPDDFTQMTDTIDRWGGQVTWYPATIVRMY